MKTKDFEKLFFSKARDYLDVYLSKQCSRSPATVKSYRDALTIFKRYVIHEGYSLKKFTYEDCTRDFLLGYMEYLQKNGYEKSSCNQRLAAIKSYMWYVADGNITWQQNALMVSKVPFLKNPEKEKEILNEECLKALLLIHFLIEFFFCFLEHNKYPFVKQAAYYCFIYYICAVCCTNLTNI